MRQKQRRPQRQLKLESLEARELLATVTAGSYGITIEGTQQADTVEVRPFSAWTRNMSEKGASPTLNGNSSGKSLASNPASSAQHG